MTQVIVVTKLSITEAMAVIQSKRKMQQSFFIQEDTKSNRTIIYICMASSKKWLMLWATGDICICDSNFKGHLYGRDGKKKEKEILCRKSNTAKPAESLWKSENSCWENFL